MAVDYNAIAKKRISRPSQSKTYPRILIYARNKKGKSTFGISAGVEQTLVLDPEHGTDEMKTTDPHRWLIEKWEDLEDAVGFLRYGDHNYKWVCFDGMTKFHNMALRYVMKVAEERALDRQPGLVQQRDHGKAGELTKELINRAFNLKMGVIFTAQERMDEGFDSEEDEEVEQAEAIYIPDLPRGARGALNAVVDVIGRLYVVKDDDGKPQRRLWIGESVRYDTGYRSDHDIPPYLDRPTVPRLIRLIRTGNPNPPKKK